MTFIATVPLSQASEDVLEMYERNQEQWGYVPNYVKAYSNRPNVLTAWGTLSRAIRANMDRRRFELVTVAAARALRNSYCLLAHAPVLTEDDAPAIAADFRAAGLADVDVAIMSYAEKIALDATSITQDDVDGLRRLGLTDQEIFDVAAAAAARCYFAKLLDALGVQPDSVFNELDEALRGKLAIGRAISRETVQRLSNNPSRPSSR
jgi:uncharacterized peroxidase-related enzyme